MKMIKYLYIALLSITLTINANTINIIDLHQNNSDGILSGQYNVGDTVTVAGIATVDSKLFSSSYLEAYIQDNTAGICLYAKSNNYDFSKGDSLLVTGKLKQYNGLTELEIIELKVLKNNCSLPEPVTLTCNEVYNSFHNDNTEPYESSLIKLENVEITGSWPDSVRLKDNTGSCMLYIDKDTELDELNIKNDTYTIIGILKQYDKSKPYKEYYEIIPRYPEDIISQKPYLTTIPQISNISYNEFQVSFETNLSCEIKLDVYNNETHEFIKTLNNTNTTKHSFIISGLQSATIYKLIIKSGENILDSILAITSSKESSGKIEVFFNKDIDSSYAISGNVAKGNVAFDSVIIDKINNANYSIDVCIYSFSLPNIANAIVDAYKKGIKVRVIYMNRDEQDGIEILRNNNIPIIDNSYGNNDGQESMHNKFIVIDNRDNISEKDDIVIISSANYTYNGLDDAAQNMLVIEDKALAKIYTKEFEQMWGSNTDTPDENNAAFSEKKKQLTPNIVNVKGTIIEQYMGPQGNIIKHIVDKIKTADYSIYFSIFAFTHRDIEYALKDKFEKENINLRGIFDDGQDDNTPYFDMIGTTNYAWYKKPDVYLDNTPFILHHKYMIIDGESPNSDPIVIAGSANWSYNVENDNDENTIIIHDYKIANQFVQEFAKRYKEAGGTGQFTNINENNSKKDNIKIKFYPNPCKNYITISTNITNSFVTTIYNIMGRKIMTQKISNNHKLSLPSNMPNGIYFYKIRYNKQTLTGKFIVIK